MSRKLHVPTRMCMGCGARAPQGELLRLTGTAGGALQIVTGRTWSGRTGYLHAQQECWDRFTARKGPLRSLGCAVDKPKRIAFIEGLRAGSRSEMG